MSPEGPSTSDLLVVQSNIEQKVEKVSDRLSRIEKGFIVLCIVVASPKIGGPSLSHLVTGALGALFGS